MGQILDVVRGTIEKIDNSAAEKEWAEELLNTLVILGRSQKENFEKAIILSIQNAGVGDNHTLPVNATLKSESASHAMVGDQLMIAEKIGGYVKDLLGTISSKGSWDKIAGAGIDIATKSLTDVIGAFLGTAEATEDTKNGYNLILDSKTMNIIRLDYYVWKKEIKISSLKDKCEKIMAFSYVKSTVDMDCVDFSTFRQYFLPMVAELYHLNPIEALPKCNKLYIQLGGGKNTSDKLISKPVQALSLF